MRHRTLLPDSAELCVESIKSDPVRVLLIVRTVRPNAACPACGSYSSRIHSHYLRKLSDLPWNGIPVLVQMRSRKFFCEAPSCGQHIFTERVPNTADVYARRTHRLSRVIDRLTMALGGEAGSRLAEQIGILASGDSLLRQLRRRATRMPATPRVLGIDDLGMA
jgi:transposase